MFGNSEAEKINAFMSVLSQLAEQTQRATPKRIHTSVGYLLERTDGFKGDSLEALINHMTKPTRKSSASTRKKTLTPKPPAPSIDLPPLLEQLTALQGNATKFEALADNISKKLKADDLKSLAAMYAHSGKPRTKTAALHLLKSSRASKERSESSAVAASTAKPW